MNGSSKRATASTMASVRPKVDFSLVAMSSLRKYKKTHRVRMRPTTNKTELAEAVAKHFAQLPPPDNEAEVIAAFAAAIKQRGILAIH